MFFWIQLIAIIWIIYAGWTGKTLTALWVVIFVGLISIPILELAGAFN